MELRSKRSQSQPKPAAFQRRRIVDNSHRENLLRMLIIEPNTDITAGHLRFPGKFRLLVHPSEKRIHEFIPPRKEFIVEEMSSKGIIFLQTTAFESEMAINTIGRRAMGGKALTILGPEQQQTQYATHIPAGLLTEQVCNVQRDSPNGPYKTGDRLRFSEELKTIERGGGRGRGREGEGEGGWEGGRVCGSGRGRARLREGEREREREKER